MKITFYGTRGSCPTPGANTLKYGGNTACVLVDSEQGPKLILDAGTGIRILGKSMFEEKQDIHLLLSHNHYDHIQGFPFFKPLYQAKRNIKVYPSPTLPHQPRAILEQMNGSYFPVDEEQVSANVDIVELDWSSQPVFINGFRVYRREINHPNGGMAFVIEYNDKRLAYVTDNELNSPIAHTSTFEWKEFLLGADLIIHDGQYIEQDMPLKAGWGHSLISEAINLAQVAHAKRLAIYSHDPERSDDELDAWQQKIDKMNLTNYIFFAYEGQTLCL